MTLTAATTRRTEVQRDRYGRPRIIQPDGTLEAYTRPSTLAKTLSDGAALAVWKQRMTAYGVATSPDLVALAATATVDDRATLGEVVSAAMERAESARGARMGTAVHKATETVDGGGNLRDVPEVVRRQVAAYSTLTEQLHPVGVETFIVNDPLKVAGTTDRLYRLPDGRVVIGDLKTSSKDAPRYSGGEWAIQLACYAGGSRYDPDTGERSVLHPDLDPTFGLVVHVPSSGDPGALYGVNLTWGLAAAELANRVRAFRKASLLKEWTP